MQPTIRHVDNMQSYTLNIQMCFDRGKRQNAKDDLFPIKETIIIEG